MIRNATIVIPATLHSRRFPRKVLAEYRGSSILRHVWQAATKARSVNDVVVATDSKEIEDHVSTWGGTVIMTPSTCHCGTERVAWVARQRGGEMFVNVQADQLNLDPCVIDEVVHRLNEAPNIVVTPIYALGVQSNLFDKNLVKVVIAKDGRALYFSRSPIPFIRDLANDKWAEAGCFWGHMGIYGYSANTLARFLNLSRSTAEEVEHLEQLRFLEHGIDVQTVTSSRPSASIDSPEDLLAIQEANSPGG